MKKSLFKLKNYEVHSVTSSFENKFNANIITWMMQSAMQGKYLAVALFKVDYTLELVKQSGILNINFLAQDQANLINKLGRKSGRDTDKFKKLNYCLDERECPFLNEAIGFIKCEVYEFADSFDHEIVVCKVLGQKILNPDKEPLTINYLREKGLVRG
ncbi:MAG: flavin reductase [Candidatus Caenarcaniphilales bacterium]|nr:flavin reductase [Candidatus Caenarcaniphilales bacterium]